MAQAPQRLRDEQRKGRLPASADDQIPDANNRAVGFAGLLQPYSIDPEIRLPTKGVEPRSRSEDGASGDGPGIAGLPHLAPMHGRLCLYRSVSSRVWFSSPSSRGGSTWTRTTSKRSA